MFGVQMGFTAHVKQPHGAAVVPDPGCWDPPSSAAEGRILPLPLEQ